jgi:hypothetical protein
MTSVIDGGRAVTQRKVIAGLLLREPHATCGEPYSRMRPVERDDCLHSKPGQTVMPNDMTGLVEKDAPQSILIPVESFHWQEHPWPQAAPGHRDDAFKKANLYFSADAHDAEDVTRDRKCTDIIVWFRTTP